MTCKLMISFSSRHLTTTTLTVVYICSLKVPHGGIQLSLLSRSLMVELSPYTCGVYMFSQGPSWQNSQLTCGVYILSRGPLYGGNSRLLNMLCMFSHKVTHGGPCQPLHFLFLRCAPLSTYARIEKPIKTVNHICTPHNSVLRCAWLLGCLFGALLGGLDHLLGAWFLLNTWLLRRLWLVFGSARFLALLTRFLSTTLVFGTAMVLALLTRFLSTTLVLHVIIS